MGVMATATLALMAITMMCHMGATVPLTVIDVAQTVLAMEKCTLMAMAAETVRPWQQWLRWYKKKER